MKHLRLANDLSLPLDTVTQKLAWLGVTGGGKTYGAMKLAELLHEAGAQFVTLDPVGVWYGLRLTKAGKPSDIAIPIFGGLHADVPLEPTGGALLADLVVDKNLSCILDVSQFESDAQKARFASDFAERLFFRRKAAPAAMHLFLEECQEFVPQNPQRGEERMLHAFTRMQKLGRNYGIGSSYISQRPQEVNKKALNMAQTLFVFRTTGVHERKAIEAWIADKSLDESIANDLPKLATGDCHVWSPEFLKVSEVVHILEKRTFDASAGAVFGVASKARELAPVDLDQVRAAMAATIEKAKADDPRELRKEIAKLKGEIAKVPAAAVSTPKTVEKAILTDADRALLEKVATSLKASADMMAMYAVDSMQRIAQDLRDRLSLFSETSESIASKGRDSFLSRLDSKGFQNVIAKLSAVQPPTQNSTTTNAAPRSPLTRRVAPPAPATSPRPARQVSSDGEKLGRAEIAILTAAVQRLPKSSSRAQLSVLSGYSIKSSSFSNAIGKLRTLGLFTGAGDDNRATDAGVSTLGDFDPLPRGDALVRHWMGQLGKAEASLLAVFVRHYPNDVDKDTASAESGYSITSSSFSNAIGRLRTLELVKGLRASEELFS